MIRMTIRTPVMTMKHEHLECLMGGCAYEKLGAIMCKDCGNEAHEHLRRMQLPLIRGEDGLLRKYVGKEPANGGA